VNTKREIAQFPPIPAVPGIIVNYSKSVKPKIAEFLERSQKLVKSVAQLPILW